MSMGNIDHYMQVVDEKIVKKVVGATQYDEFIQLRDKVQKLAVDGEISDGLSGGDGFNDGCFGITIDPDENEDWKKLTAAYQSLQETFEQKTGMHVSFVYFPADGGDCYDDIEADTWEWVLNSNDVWVPKTLTSNAEAFVKQYKKFGQIQLDARFSTFG